MWDPAGRLALSGCGPRCVRRGSLYLSTRSLGLRGQKWGGEQHRTWWPPYHPCPLTQGAACPLAVTGTWEAFGGGPRAHKPTGAQPQSAPWCSVNFAPTQALWGLLSLISLLQEALPVSLPPSRSQRPEKRAPVATAEVNSPEWPIPRRIPMPAVWAPSHMGTGDLRPWGVGCREAPFSLDYQRHPRAPHTGPWELERRGSMLLGDSRSLGRLAACVLGSLGPGIPGGEEVGWAGLGVSWTSRACGSL